MCTQTPPMKRNFVYFGTPYVARDTLATLVAHGFVPSLVVTSPDAQRGRGMTLTPSETKTWALEHTYSSGHRTRKNNTGRY
jgi:methionyl-tRNA formyltransferase